MSKVYILIGAKNYLGSPIPDIEVCFQKPLAYPALIPVTNTDGIAKIWIDKSGNLRGTFYFHDPKGIYAGLAVTREVDFTSKIAQWVTLEELPYLPPQQDLT